MSFTVSLSFCLSSLHINVSLHFTSAETGGCNPSESALEFDSLRGDIKSILEFHFSQSDFEADRWTCRRVETFI